MRAATTAATLAAVLMAGAAEAARVNVTLTVDPEQLAGADADGRLLPW